MTKQTKSIRVGGSRGVKRLIAELKARQKRFAAMGVSWTNLSHEEKKFLKDEAARCAAAIKALTAGKPTIVNLPRW